MIRTFQNMTRRPLSPLGLISVCLMVCSTLFLGSTEGGENDDKALIVVSNYGGTDQNELDKAVDLYDYLISIGLGSDDIMFLCAENLTMRDGDPSTSKVEDGLKWLAGNSTPSSDSIVYISDHSHVIRNNCSYRFQDGNLSISDVEDYIDETSFSSLAYITTGDCSGLIGSQLSGERRVVMSSMAYDEEATTDRFSIARGLENISADRNCDGWVTFVEAFYWEESYVEQHWDQDPQIWI